MANQSSTNQISRPIAGFHPCHWGDHFLNLALILPPKPEILVEKEKEIYQLKVEVGKLLAAAQEPLVQLTFIDTLERLGVSYHFEEEIEQALELAYERFHGDCENADLNHVSLRFRIFRQHGFYVPCDVFNKFKDENGRFKGSLTKDVQGMLSLYEASHVRVDDDKILDEALAFTTAHLTTMANNNLSSPLGDQVAHALHQPLHLGIPRVEARFYISIYEKDPLHNQLVLQFAKLDFNFVQSLHQRELKELKSWWKGLHLKASFSRDRITEAYFWTVGVYFEPQFSFARKQFRKGFKIISLLDDTYDAYGTLEELKVLTEAFQRPWNKDVAEELPEHVKWCYYAFVEACEEVEEDLAKEGRAFCVKYLREQVNILCKGYMQEAEWCNQKYVPTYEEYMKNAIITSPYPIATIMSFLGMGEIASEECFEWATQNPIPDVIKAASIIIRLMNDMGGHEFEQSRIHVASSVQCLMEHNKVTKNEANKMLTKEVEDAWKVINKAMLRPHVIPKPLLTRILNLDRSAHVFYHGSADGYTNVNKIVKDKLDSVLARPISM